MVGQRFPNLWTVMSTADVLWPYGLTVNFHRANGTVLFHLSDEYLVYF